MALPIKANDTQEGCNPTSSNCVIWQGPDIPCINLCRGDSISDVTAKLAERLCTILDYLDVTAYDLTCFNPICTTPSDFQGLIQLLIERICAINNIPVTPGGAAGCPDCVVPVAQCLQRPDALGNITASLQLKDYVILIGNEICSIATSISSVELRVASLEAAVTDIQDNCCNSTPAAITVPGSVCIFTGNPSNIPIVDFVVQLESAFCALQTAVGAPSVISTTISSQCIDGSTESLSRPGVNYSNLPNWINPTNLAQTVTDLWVVVCDYRTAIQSLQTTVLDLQAQLSECCQGNCTDIVWSINRIDGITGSKFINLFFTGNPIPSGFDYCTPNSSTITVTNMASPPATATFAVTTGTNDIINAINNNSSIALNVADSAATEESIWYEVYVELCATNGTLTCSSNTTVSLYNGAFCDGLNPTVTSLASGSLTVNFTIPPTPSITTSYSVRLYTNTSVIPVGPAIPLLTNTYTWTGLSPATYYVKVSAGQTNSRYGVKSLDCPSNGIEVS